MKLAASILPILVVLGACHWSNPTERFRSGDAIIMHAAQGSPSYIIIDQRSYLISELPPRSHDQFMKLEGRLDRDKCLLVPFFVKAEGAYVDRARAKIEKLSVLRLASRSSIEGSDFKFRPDYICDFADLAAGKTR